MHSYFMRQNFIYNVANSAAKIGNNAELPNKNAKYRISCDVFISKTSKAYLKILKRDLPKQTGPLNLYQCDNYSSTAAWVAANGN